MVGSLKRELGAALLTGIGVGAVIGSGVYTLPGLVASVSGPLSIVAIVLMSVITLVLMYVIAELGRLYPRAGGLYYFAREALGDLAGFITGLSFYFCCFIGTAAIIYAFLLYLSYYVPGIAVELTLTPLGIVIAIVVLAIVTVINIVGVKYGAGLNFILTIARIAPLLVFIAIGLTRMNIGNFEPFTPYGLGSIGLAVAFGFWMFVGFESIVLVGEEVREPEKTIAKSAMATVSIITIVYILIMTAFVGAIDWEGLGMVKGDWESIGGLSAPLADVSRAIGMVGLAELMVVGAVIASAGCFSDWVLLQGRVAYALAREDRFWKPLAYVNPRFGTPSRALVFSSILTAVIMLLVPSFPNVILMAMIAEFIPYGISSVSLSVARGGSKMMAVGAIGFVLASLYIYWACWPWTLTGSVIAIISLVLYPVIVKNPSIFSRELKRNAWYIVYLAGLTLISLLGDAMFEYNNFLPISPLNILATPRDILVITIFGIAVFTWAIKVQKSRIS
ncbi:MAG: APC family permease [Ignisphaera sp.]|nr:APC family permease [Ignisphaera sp.]MDW8085704.1 APC family permease [Ignisphaera sp.]